MITTRLERLQPCDGDIRRALLSKLRSQYRGGNSLLIEELGLCQASAIIDVAVIGDILSGFEIKSGRDTLSRLPAQQRIYNRVFDRLTVVTSPQHLEGVQNLVPAWWGITVAEGFDRDVQLNPLREPQTNPAVDSYAVAQLLWRDEALEVLRGLGAARGVLSKPRKVVWKLLADRVTPSDLRSMVRNTLESRKDWRACGL